MKGRRCKMAADKARLALITIISLLVLATGVLFTWTSYNKGGIAGAALSSIISLTILGFFFFTFIRSSKDLKEGYPIKDERSARVLEKASSKAFYISLYLLLAMGFFSDSLIKFRDVSQATSLAVGGMALLFFACWLYYNGKAL
jgi:uncharacterized membrane protein